MENRQFIFDIDCGYDDVELLEPYSFVVHTQLDVLANSTCVAIDQSNELLTNQITFSLHHLNVSFGSIISTLNTFLSINKQILYSVTQRLLSIIDIFQPTKSFTADGIIRILPRIILKIILLKATLTCEFEGNRNFNFVQQRQ